MDRSSRILERVDIASASDYAFGWYFAGLFDGEGCLSVQRNARTGDVQCVAVIALRRDSRPLLEKVRDRTGLGSIYTRGETVRWAVQARSELRSLLRLMAKTPGLSNKFSDQAPLLLELLDLMDIGEQRGSRARDIIDRLSDLKNDPEVEARSEHLVCEIGGHTWQRPFRRGRKPQRCPAHAHGGRTD